MIPLPPLARIVKIAGADGRIWLLLENGEIAAIDRDNDVRLASPQGKAFDMCASNGSITVATASGEGKRGRWTLHRNTWTGWKDLATVASDNDEPIAIACLADVTTILTSRRAIVIDSARRRNVMLDDTIRPALVNSVAIATVDAVYLGQNNGEWGGGLRRINLATGKVAVIEHNDSGSICGGPLNGGCDPVNGLAINPWKPNCVLAATGLVHMAPHGRILEICGTTIRRLYFRPYPGMEDENRRAAENVKDDPQFSKNDEPFMTEAFFGMAVVGQDVWVAGTGWLYRFKSDVDAPVIIPLPKFRRTGQVSIAYVEPGLALVESEINSKASLGMAVPMMTTQ